MSRTATTRARRRPGLLQAMRQLLGLARTPLREPMLGLAPGEVSQIAELRHEPHWQTYLDALDSAAILYGEAILQSRDAAVIHELRGTVIGLRKAATIVDEILHRRDELDRVNQSRDELAQRREGRRDAALYGTPAWDGRGGRPDGRDA